MKRSYPYRITGAILLLTLGASGGQYCWQIRDPDRKALCESRFEGQNACWKIQNRDLQAYCEATALGKNSCWKIKEHDLQMFCKAAYSSNHTR